MPIRQQLYTSGTFAGQAGSGATGVPTIVYQCSSFTPHAAGGAGSTTGVADSPSTGTAGLWVDPHGNVGSVDGSGRMLVSTDTTDGSQYLRDYLYHSDTTTLRDEKVAITVPGGGFTSDTVIDVILRYQTGSGACYLAGWGTVDGGLGIYKIVAGSATFLPWSGTAPGNLFPVAGQPLTLAVQAVGASPTTITLTATCNGATVTGVAVDSEPTLQGAGAAGVGIHTEHGIATPVQSFAVTQATITDLGTVGAPSFTLSPATAAAGTPVTVTATGLNTNWVNGSTAFSVTGGTGASVSALAVADATHASFTLTPGSATGTLTLHDTADSATAAFTVTSAGGTSLAVGPLSVYANDPAAGITVQWAAATGGTQTAVSYTLYRSSSPITGGNAGTAAAGPNPGTRLTDPNPGSAPVYYRVTATDSGSNTARSSQSASQTSLFTRRATAPTVLWHVGDSITAGLNASGPSAYATTVCDAQVAAYHPLSPVVTVNNGASGSATSQWVAGSGLMNAAVAAVEAAKSANPGAKVVGLVMLGTNDAKAAVATPTSGYSANMANVVATMLNHCDLVVLNAPIYVVPGSLSGAWDETADVTLAAYRDALPALADGIKSFAGYLEGIEYYAANTGLLGDGVHPTDAGYAVLGAAWAGAVRAALAGGGGIASAASIATQVVAALGLDLDGQGRVFLAPNGLDAVQVEQGVNARQALSPVLAACAGRVTGVGTGTVTIRAAANPTVTRIVSGTDSAGDRVSVTLNLPT